MKKLLITVAAAGMTLATGAFAQDASSDSTKTNQGSAQSELTFQGADIDKSGGISLAEAQGTWADLTQEQFTAADANGDGMLDQVEFDALVTKMQMSSSQSTTSGDTSNSNGSSTTSTDSNSSGSSSSSQ